MDNNRTFQYSPSDNSCIPLHRMAMDDGRKNTFYMYDPSLSCSIIIAVFSPVAVIGNALILAAIWKKTFPRTTFHTLLSGLAITDLCTGLIAQPFTALTDLLHLKSNDTNSRNKQSALITIDAIGDASATYFISTTVFIITIMGIERWLYMTQRSLVTSNHGYFVVVVLLIIPIPVVVLRAIETINGNPAFEFNITIIVSVLLCLLITSIAYFNVLRIIRRHQKQVQATAPSRNVGQTAAINLRKYKKSVFTILYILGLFYFCFLPFAISIGVYVYVGSDRSDEVGMAINATRTLLFLSSSLNPGLYLWRMNDVRQGVKQLFCWNH